MILIYAYIKKFRNYAEQEICFDSSYRVKFSEGQLSITFCGRDEAGKLFENGKKPDNLHLLVGKTGSGKTNLLQIIGSPYAPRSQRKWGRKEDSYFLLYMVNENDFFLEICDVDIRQFPQKTAYNNTNIPDSTRENAWYVDTLRTVRFKTERHLKAGETATVFQKFEEFEEFGYKPATSVMPARDMAMVINCYDIHAFIQPPYPDEKDLYDTGAGSWLTRKVIPYHRTSLWSVCSYIRDYLTNIEPGDGKRKASLVLSARNFAEQYPLKLPKAVEKEYWTFYEIKLDENRAFYDAEAKERMSRGKKKRDYTNKEMFIHDLWTDYAKYLRKWAEKIQSYTAGEKIAAESPENSDTGDVYLELLDYYAEKVYGENIDSSRLPDGERLSIVKRCTWLAEYIDRKADGYPHGLIWQMIGDIGDIVGVLSKLDEKYFTINTCTVPVVDMVLPEYKGLFEELFERMEQYVPDDEGIFTEVLLPYKLTCLSTGEYQYAKVLGGMEDYLKIFEQDGKRKKTFDKIILLDEPEAYMHPELARQFIARLYDIIGKYKDSSTVQVIISTHCPFMLSDVLPNEITRLDIDRKSGNAIVKNGSEKEYFGANIHTILSDGFFLNYTIGEYSRKFLQDTYRELEGCLQETGITDNENREFLNAVRKMIPHIGDRLIRRAFEIALEEWEGNHISGRVQK